MLNSEIFFESLNKKIVFTNEMANLKPENRRLFLKKNHSINCDQNDKSTGMVRNPYI